MIARAKADTNDPEIGYRIADLEQLQLPKANFDFAYSSLAFHYVEDFARLVRTVHQALTPDAHFLFTIEHPIYMASRRAGWRVDADGNKFWPVDQYSVEGRRTTDWLAPGVVKYHRTIGTTLNTLIGAGFTLRHVQEWRPSAEQIAANPDLAEEMERPMILIVDAQR
jgi:SAM-dependent methyltransferase